ncbi:hypothetical protein HN510_05530 [Candidatus Woesearchaeota archaeon]|jgi:hypothetical protein|nr:hypothetical protein [Candidatus Woesearchaeota archaeon]
MNPRFIMFKKIFRKTKTEDEAIGYSIYLPDEGCYEYNEDECLIFDTFESAKELANTLYSCPSYHRIYKVTIHNIIDDYGGSCGGFAFETAAMKKFADSAEKRHNYMHY